MLGWVRPSRAGLGPVRTFYFRVRTQGRVFEGQGSGVREQVGVEGIGQRSAQYKPLPHAPRTAVWLVFPVFKHGSGRREVAITQRATENLVFPASPHTAHIWSQATCSYNGTLYAHKHTHIHTHTLQLLDKVDLHTWSCCVTLQTIFFPDTD